MLIDFERRKAIDLTFGREAEDVKKYPQVEIVSRDRLRTYTNAVNVALTLISQTGIVVVQEVVRTLNLFV